MAILGSETWIMKKNYFSFPFMLFEYFKNMSLQFVDIFRTIQKK